MKCDYEVFKKLLSWKTEGKYCIEVNFAVDGSEKYSDCWLGKMPSPDIPGTDSYWYGLVADGSEEYDYTSREGILSAKVFGGKSIAEIWENVSFLEIDGCEPERRIEHYMEFIERQKDGRHS